MTSLLHRLASVCLFILALESEAEELVFQCSWDDSKPILITVDTTNKTAKRDDGGSKYNVVKVTPYVVWLSIVDPENQAGLAIQMIQRSAAVDGKAGKWVDVVQSMTGRVSEIDGGKCWER
jgi:hypothetical protein